MQLASFEGGFDEPAPAAAPNPLQTIHLLLHGRYWLAILLAIVCGGLAATAGFYAKKPTWTSSGTIEIKPVLPKILFSTEQSSVMPMFDSFVGTQVALLRSERVMDNAMQSDAWRAYKRGNSPAAIQQFAQSVAVTRIPDTDMIGVSFTDKAADAAVDAVRSIIDAYQKIYVENDAEGDSHRLKTLEEYRDKLSGDLKDRNNQILAICQGSSPEALEERYQWKMEQANRNEALWQDAKTQLAQLALSEGNSGATTMPVVKQSVEDIAQTDTKMAQLLAARDGYKHELEKLRTAYAEESAIVRSTRAALDVAQNDLDEYFSSYKPRAIDPSTGRAHLDARALAAQESLAHAEYESSIAEALELGKKLAQIKAIKIEVDDIRQRLDETKTRIDQINLESQVSGRITIISNGARPVEKDLRLALAGGGGVFGVAFGVGIVLLLSLLDGRLRSIDQARLTVKHGNRFLGILPSLPTDLEDPESASIAAMCVHHIRTLLQVTPGLNKHPAIAVTSPSSGDGKTSMVLALGFSYAATKARTLLVDGDVVGAGLTRRVDAIIRRRLGEVLVKEGLITRTQLAEALDAAQRTGHRLGQVIVDAGILKEEQLRRALELQSETSVGLLDVMEGEPLERCVAPTGVPGLFVLPIGSAHASHAASLSPEAIRAIIERAREQFDVVIFDTGPIPGSIEASVIASQVDGTVLMVSRGEQKSLAQRAADHLEILGARNLGVVFNRARADDYSSSYAGSLTSPNISIRPKTDGASSAVVSNTKFGPIASAVVSQLTPEGDAPEKKA